MGIPFLFAFLRSRYPDIVNPVKEGLSTEVDVLCIDLNSVIHNACQIVYGYGNGEKLKSLKPRKEMSEFQLKRKVYEKISYEIEKILDTVRPRKSMVICIDGPACLAKQNQQRQRRARAASERKEDAVFDSTCITPGTEWLDGLSRYLDSHIRYQSSIHPNWMNIETIFSHEKVPGEGEHGLISYIRKLNDKSLTYLIHGLDADLIMLALGTQCPRFYIMREDAFSSNFISVTILREYLFMELDPDGKREIDEVIDDFIFLCFLLGNDFLPHSPSLEILKDGILVLTQAYSDVGKKVITRDRKKGQVSIDKESLKEILKRISKDEISRLEERSRDKSFFPDPLYDKDFDKYRDNYYQAHFEGVGIFVEEEKKTLIDHQKIAHMFLDGMSWVINYYLYGIPSWTWMYPYSYSPFITEILEHIDTWKEPTFYLGGPIDPFLQLLYVLPKESAGLLPSPLNQVVKEKNSSFTLDLAGKRFDWQAIVLMPKIDLEYISGRYHQLVSKVDEKDLRRNELSKARKYVYKHNGNEYTYNSLYGKFTCKTAVVSVDL